MAGNGVLELTDQNFAQEVLQSNVPVVVDFWAEWCMPCRMLAPTIEQLATEFAGKVKVGKVDTDSNREVSMQFAISAIPTVMVFHNGQVVKKFVGVTPKQEFVGALQKLTS
ncbi:MAG: thioredoxin [Phycisphaeraceae bacterium]|nr:thioredoxin [Phycisphaeraceae bacterium]